MKTIVLPGMSLHNKDWAYEVKEKVKVDGKIIVIEWESWKPKIRKSFGFKHEVERVKEALGEDEVNIIAKSVGTRVLMEIIPEKIKQIKNVILCGIPFDPLRYSPNLKMIAENNLLVFQNSKDPFVPFSLIKLYLKAINPKIKIIEGKRSDHHYPYYEEFSSFLGSSS